MRKEYEAPELMLIGDADEVVLGAGGFTGDLAMQGVLDFEFEED